MRRQARAVTIDRLATDRHLRTPRQQDRSSAAGPVLRNCSVALFDRSHLQAVVARLDDLVNRHRAFLDVQILGRHPPVAGLHVTICHGPCRLPDRGIGLAEVSG